MSIFLNIILVICLPTIMYIIDSPFPFTVYKKAKIKLDFWSSDDDSTQQEKTSRAHERGWPTGGAGRGRGELVAPHRRRLHREDDHLGMWLGQAQEGQHYQRQWCTGWNRIKNLSRECCKSYIVLLEKIYFVHFKNGTAFHTFRLRHYWWYSLQMVLEKQWNMWIPG